MAGSIHGRSDDRREISAFREPGQVAHSLHCSRCNKGVSMKPSYPIVIIATVALSWSSRASADERSQHQALPSGAEGSGQPGSIRAEVFGNLGLLGRRSTQLEDWGIEINDELAPSLGAGVGLSLLLSKHFGIGGRFEVTRFAHEPNQGVVVFGGRAGLAGAGRSGGLGGVGLAGSGPASEDFVVIDVALLPRVRFPISGSRAAVYGIVPVGVSIYEDSQTGLRYGGMAGLETFISSDLGFFSELGYQVRTRADGNETLGYAPMRVTLSELSIRLGVVFSP